MIKIVFIILLYLNLSDAIGQTQLSLKQGSWGMKYYADGVKISKSKFDELILRKDPALYYEFSSGRSSVGIGNVLGFAGGFMLGWNIGNLITGRSKKFTLGGAGLGLVVITIPIQSSGYKKMKQTIDIYNSTP